MTGWRPRSAGADLEIGVHQLTDGRVCPRWPRLVDPVQQAGERFLSRLVLVQCAGRDGLGQVVRPFGDRVLASVDPDPQTRRYGVCRYFLGGAGSATSWLPP